MIELGSVADVFNGKTPSKAEQRLDGLPVLKIRDIDENGNFLGKYGSYVDQEFYSKYTKKRLHTGDTIILNAAHNADYVGNKNALVPNELNGIIATGEWLIVRPKEIHPEFVNQFLKSPVGRQKIKKEVKGIHLYPRDVARIKIPDIKAEDQIRIATLLSRVEALIATRKNNLQQLDDFLKSTFWEMFGDNASNKKKLPSEPLGKYITHITSGGRGWAKYYSEKGKRFIRSLDVQMNKIGNNDLAYVNPPKNQEAVRTKVQDGDVLLTITGSKIGRVTYVPNYFEEAYISQHVCIIRTEGINPVYLSFYLSMPNGGQRLIKKHQYGQAKPGLNLTQIKEFQILIPKKDKQEKFAVIVDKIEFLKSAYQQSLFELENLYGVISQKAFKGELDLSRVPLPVEPVHKVHEVTLTDQVPVSDEVLRIVEYPMSVPEERRKLLRALFDDYLAEHKGESISLDDFWRQAGFKVLDYMDESDQSWVAGDYDQLKDWLFDLIRDGKLEQRFVKNKEQAIKSKIELTIKA